MTLLRLISTPDPELLTPESVKSYLRIDTDLDDSDLQGLIESARDWLEAVTGRNYGVSSYIQFLSGFNDITLPRSPYVDESISIKYIDENEQEQELTDHFRMQPQPDPARLVFMNPPVALSKTDEMPVMVEFEAGYTDQNVPGIALTAMKLFISHYYNHRDLSDKRLDYTMDITQKLNHLIAPLRVRRFL